MTLDERRSLVTLVFPAIDAAADGLHRLRPHQDWLPYIAAAAAHIAYETTAAAAPGVVWTYESGRRESTVRIW